MLRPTTEDAGFRVPSLTGTTIRRTLRIGWLYFAIGSGVSTFLALVLALGAPTAFGSTFPLELPLFAVLGSTGGLMTFSSDRTKGVFEYLISYGVRPRALFVNGLLSAVAMVAIILTIALSVGVSAAVANGVPITADFGKAVAFYSIPMSLAAALFTATVGMIWSSLATPRTGMNSPVGVAPMIGIAPTLIVVIAASAAPASQFYYVTLGGAAILIAGVAVLLALSARLMVRERFLSPL